MLPLSLSIYMYYLHLHLYLYLHFYFHFLKNIRYLIINNCIEFNLIKNRKLNNFYGVRYYSTINKLNWGVNYLNIGLIFLNKDILHPDYVAGLADAESTFTISITKDNRVRKSSKISNKDIYYVHPSFAVSLNINKFLDCGIISENNKYIQLKVSKFEDIKSKIIIIFATYSMHGIKQLNYLDFCKILD